MRLTVEQHPKTNEKTSGIRKCDSCNKEEFVVKPRRWDLCINCVRKKSHKEGRSVAPKNFKKVTPVNFCKNCDKCFDIKNEHYRNQTFCSATCWGDTRKGISPANKIWDSLEDRSDYYYQKYKADPKRWLAILVRNRVKVVLKTQVNRKRIKNINIGKTEEMIGCTTEFLMKHIESQFELNMTWENWGLHGWHIDHIYPLSKFNLTDREQLLQACNYRNLKPMWATENRKKHAKIVVSLEDVMNKEYNYDC